VGRRALLVAGFVFVYRTTPCNKNMANLQKNQSKNVQMMETRTDVGSRWYYRLLKVFVYGILILFIVSSVFGVVNEFGPKFDAENSVLICNNGKVFPITENDYIISRFRNSFDKEWRSLCIPDDVKEFAEQTGGSVLLDEKNYDLKIIYSSRDWSGTVGLSVLAVFAILLLFLGLRSIFYYVVFGSFSRKKIDKKVLR